MADTLHQMTISFAPREDRLLLRLGTAAHVEFRLWLTRRVVRQMWTALMKAAETVSAVIVQPEKRTRQAVMSMRHEAAVQSGDFTQTRDPEAKPHPLNKTPFLVTGLVCSSAPDNHTNLTFKVDGGRDIQLSLDEKLVHALCHLLVSGTTKADWNLALAIAEPDAAQAMAEGRRLH